MPTATKVMSALRVVRISVDVIDQNYFARKELITELQSPQVTSMRST